MRRIAVMLGIVTAGFSSSAYADGFIWQLPKDGVWALYDFEQTVEYKGRQIKNEFTLRISSVGRQTVKDEECRWIEIQHGPGPARIILKVLIPESHLQAGRTPIDHVISGWERRTYKGEGKTKPLRDLGYGSGLLEILGGPLQDLERLEPRQIDSGLGSLRCAGIRGTAVIEYKPKDLKYFLTATYWLNKKSPFGVVTAELEISTSSGDPPHATRKFKIVKSGEGAVSQLPDAK